MALKKVAAKKPVAKKVTTAVKMTDEQKKAAADAKAALVATEKAASEEAKAKVEAEAEKARKTTRDIVAKDVKEINVRFEKAAKLEADADDHRLAAAILLANAEKKLTAVNVNFKAWYEENIKQSWETGRKLLTVGKADDPALALADMRGKNKEANKKLREKAKADKLANGNKPQAAALRLAGEAKKPTETPFTRAEAMLASLDDNVRYAVANAVIEKAGNVAMTQARAKAFNQWANKEPQDHIREQFLIMKAQDKMPLLEELAKSIGAIVTIPGL